MKKSEMVCATCIKGDQWKNKFLCFNFPSTEEINRDPRLCWCGQGRWREDGDDGYFELLGWGEWDE